jgi:hypothetical protein
MIGQVTPLGMANIGWRFYILFIVCEAGKVALPWAEPAKLTRTVNIGHEY